MENINIGILFPEVKHSRFGLIDVDSICDSHKGNSYDPREQKYKKSDFNVKELINHRKKKVENIKNLYKLTVNKCLDKIKRENDKKKTDTIFHIPNELILNENFDVDRCITRIEKKLQDLNIDTLRLSYSQLFISWFNVH